MICHVCHISMVCLQVLVPWCLMVFHVCHISMVFLQVWVPWYPMVFHVCHIYGLSTGLGTLVPYGLPCVSYIYGLSTGSGPLVPYGLPCVRELFRFLMSLTNPLDRQNTDVMVHMGLSLLTVALEAGADHISKFNSLLYLIKDDMCKNLFFVSP